MGTSGDLSADFVAVDTLVCGRTSRICALLVEHLTNLVAALNHDVRSGSLEGLPLFFGYAERFRTDADTMVGVSSVLDRQLARLEECVSALKEQSRRDA